jgi:hypothetical protein
VSDVLSKEIPVRRWLPAVLVVVVVAALASFLWPSTPYRRARAIGYIGATGDPAQPFVFRENADGADVAARVMAGVDDEGSPTHLWIAEYDIAVRPHWRACLERAVLDSQAAGDDEAADRMAKYAALPSKAND